MAVNGKKKGNSFEGKIAKLFSEKLQPLNFKRSEGSGARVGGQNAILAGNYSKLMLALFTGDVVPINECVEGNPKFKFCIECKAYKEAERMEALFETSKIYSWLEEIRIDAEKIDKSGIVIFKFNNTPIYCAVGANIEFPFDVKYVRLIDGEKVCHLDDLILHRSFWIEEII